MNKRQKEVLAERLAAEKDIFKKIEAVYKEALNDIGDKVKILQADDLQSKIYQAEFQKSIKKQIENILDVTTDKNYTNIAEYLNDCYNSGFIGTMYDLAGQGIPLIVPINQEQLIKAVTLDSKISEGLYKKMGVDAKDLKKRITAEVSRGIATNIAYKDIARNLNNVANIGINKAKRIAQTEGHRIAETATHDAQIAAKEAGADVVKQWDATLDGATRDTHRQLDGQIREIDEPFEVDGMQAMFPGDFGDPAEDCNCRCASLQRARWALDEDELAELEGRASFFGLDKTNSFEEYRKKYLEASSKSGMMKMNLQFFAKKSDKDAIDALIKNGTVDKAEFDRCHKYFRNAFKKGVKSPIEMVYDKNDQFYHIAQRHINMISEENIDRILKSISNPTNIYETVDKLGIKAKGYVLDEKGKNTLLTIVRSGIISSYEPNAAYLKKIKAGKKLW